MVTHTIIARKGRKLTMSDDLQISHHRALVENNFTANKAGISIVYIKIWEEERENSKLSGLCH